MGLDAGDETPEGLVAILSLSSRYLQVCYQMPYKPYHTIRHPLSTFAKRPRLSLPHPITISSSRHTPLTPSTSTHSPPSPPRTPHKLYTPSP